MENHHNVKSSNVLIMIFATHLCFANVYDEQAAEKALL